MKISVIIPSYNEEMVIEQTWSRVKQVMTENGYHDHELIFVDDGSTDRTLEVLNELARKDPQTAIVSFSRNFGHEAAKTAGIHHCTGDIAFIIDADLQDPPELFPEMIAVYEREQCNAVYGVRKSRNGETLFKKFTAKLFYRFYNYLSDVEFPVDTGDFRLIDKRIIDEFKKAVEKGKYVRGLLTWVGFKQVPFYYVRDPRRVGETKYNYRRMIDLACRAIFSFTKKPLRLVLTTGVLFVSLSMLLVIGMLTGRSVMQLPEWLSTFAIVMFFGGVQLLSIGVIAHYISIIFDEVKRRPEYIVQQKINIE